MKLSLHTIRIVCLSVIMSLAALPLLSGHASMMQHQGYDAVEQVDHIHASASQQEFDNFKNINANPHDDSNADNDHNNNCCSGFCVSMLMIPNDVTAYVPLPEQHLGTPMTGQLTRHVTELHRPPNA